MTSSNHIRQLFLHNHQSVICCLTRRITSLSVYSLSTCWHFKLQTRSYHMYMLKWSFFVLSKERRRHLVNDISSKIMFDENLTIYLSLRFRLSITIQGRIQDFPWRGHGPIFGGCGPLTWELFGENVCENERIGSHPGGVCTGKFCM